MATATAAPSRRRRFFGTSVRPDPPVAQLATTSPRRYNITSAALRKIGDDDSRSTRRRRRRLSQTDRSWQELAFEYSEKVGELGTLLEQQANTVSLFNFPIERFDEQRAEWISNSPAADDRDNPADDFDPLPLEIMANLQGPHGFATLMWSAAYNMFAVGEVYLVATPDPDAPDRLLWEFLSVNEIRVGADGRYERWVGDVRVETLRDDASYVKRLWKPHPEYSLLATSQVKRVLPICQQISMLTSAALAAVMSRIAAPILFIPDELSFAPDPEPEDPDADPNDNPVDPNAEDRDDIADELYDHWTAPITDETSASRIVPPILRGKGEYGAMIEVISVARDSDDREQEQLDLTIRRLAVSLDAPPDMLAPRSSANHWNLPFIDGEFVIKQCQPVARRIADFLTRAYLRPLMEFSGVDKEYAERFRVVADPSPVLARLDEAKSARDLADWLSDEAILAANGFTAADKASDDTVRNRRLWTLVLSQPAMYGRLLPMVPGFEDVDPSLIGPATTEVIDVVHGQPPTSSNGDGLDRDTTPVPQDGQVTPPTGAGDDVVDKTSGMDTPEPPEALALLVRQIVTAADHELVAARDRATSRAISSFQSNDEVKLRLRAVAKSRVLSALTPEERSALSVDRLLRDAFDGFETATRAWVGEFLVERGVPYAKADGTAAAVAQALALRMREFARETLWSPLRRVGGLHVEPSAFETVVAAAVAEALERDREPAGV